MDNPQRLAIAQKADKVSSAGGLEQYWSHSKTRKAISLRSFVLFDSRLRIMDGSIQEANPFLRKELAS